MAKIKLYKSDGFDCDKCNEKGKFNRRARFMTSTYDVEKDSYKSEFLCKKHYRKLVKHA